MKTLICIPAVKNVDVTREAVVSVIQQPVDVILAQNGADDNIKELFQEFGRNYHNMQIWDEPVNIAVNPIWNKFMKYFLDNEKYTHLCLHSNDVIMQHQFLHVYYRRMSEYPQDVCIASEVDKEKVYRQVDPLDTSGIDIKGGVAGFSIWLTRKHVEHCYPIPNEIKLWYGDTFIYELLHRLGYNLVVLNNFQAHHVGSATLQLMANTNELIQTDQLAWPGVKEQLEARIQKIKNDQSS